MPPPERAYLKQRAVLWRMTGYNAQGLPTLATQSEEIKCRFDERRTEKLGPKGVPIAVDGMMVVEVDIAVGSQVWLGSHDDLAASVTGTGEGPELIPESGVMDVVTFTKTPDLRGRHHSRVIGLKRNSDTLAVQGD